MADPQKTPAVVLRRVPWSNSSLVVHCLSPDAGLVEAVAKGARRPKSRFAGRLDLFLEGELVYYPRRSGALHVAGEFAIDSEHMPIRSSLPRFAAAACMAEAAAALAAPDEPAISLYRLLSEGYAYLDAGRDAGPVALVFVLAALGAAGFAPSWAGCVLCGGGIDPDAAYVDAVHGGAVCETCRHADGRAQPVAPAVWKTIRYYSEKNYDQASRFNPRRTDLAAAWETALALVRAQTGRRIRSGRLLERCLAGEPALRSAV